MNSARAIVIIGFMGCGKTEIARRLAVRQQLPMIDLDHEIATRTGRTAAQLIVAKGEPAFREIETDTLREVFREGIFSVVALGGGAWIKEANRRLISEHGALSVWLDTPFDLCWQRIAASPEDRPLGRTREQAEQIYLQRYPIYQLANVRVPVMAHEPIEKLVDRLEIEVKNQIRGSPAAEKTK